VLLALDDLLLEEGRLAEPRTSWPAAQGRLSGRPGSTPAGPADAATGQWVNAARDLEWLRTQAGGQAKLAAEIDWPWAPPTASWATGPPGGAYHRGLEADPLSVPLRLALGLALSDQGKDEEAASELRQALTRRDVPPAGWLLLGRVLLRQELRLLPTKRAWRDFNEAADRAAAALPDSPDVLLLRADALFAQEPDRPGPGVGAQGRAEERPTCPSCTSPWPGWSRRGGTTRRRWRRCGGRPRSSATRSSCASPGPATGCARGGAAAGPELAAVEQGVAKLPPAEQARLLRGLADVLPRGRRPPRLERQWRGWPTCCPTT